MKKILFAFAVVCCMVSCSNNEPKEFEKVRNTKSLSEAEKYLKEFADAPQEHLEAIEARRMFLFNDSITFASITSTTNAVERYTKEANYLSNFKDGNHTEEVIKMLEKDKVDFDKAQKEKAEAAQLAQYAEWTNAFSKYKYILSSETFSFSNPNKEGKGTVNYHTSYDNSKNNGTYQIDLTSRELHITMKGWDKKLIAQILDNGQLLITINGSDYYFDKTLK